jgi:hypothetical protein
VTDVTDRAVTVVVGGDRYRGPAVDLRETTADADELLCAVRAGLPEPPDAPRVVAPPPGPVYEHVAHLSSEARFDRRGALAAVARARGHEPPQAADLAARRADLARLTPPAHADVRTARRRVAEAGAETDRLRERVATLRGRLNALRERGDDDADAVQADLTEATTRLSEVATERVAARQRLDRLEAEAREARDARAERLRLEDRVANLERAARRSLSAAVYDAFAAAVASLPPPFDAEAGASPGEFEGSALAAVVATARVAPLRAPVVVDGDVAAAFGGPAATRAFLDAPVLVP